MSGMGMISNPSSRKTGNSSVEFWSRQSRMRTRERRNRIEPMFVDDPEPVEEWWRPGQDREPVAIAAATVSAFRTHIFYEDGTEVIDLDL